MTAPTTVLLAPTWEPVTVPLPTRARRRGRHRAPTAAGLRVGRAVAAVALVLTWWWPA